MTPYSSNGEKCVICRLYQDVIGCVTWYDFKICSGESCCLKSLFFQHIIMTWCFHGLYFIQNKFKKTVLEKLAAPDFLKLYHHNHFFEHLVFKKRRVMFWSAPENICSPWFSQDVIKFSLTWYKTFWIVLDLYFAALNFKYMNYTSWPHVVFNKYGRYWVCAASAFSRYENLGWLSLDSMCIPNCWEKCCNCAKKPFFSQGMIIIFSWPFQKIIACLDMCLKTFAALIVSRY